MAFDCYPGSAVAWTAPIFLAFAPNVWLGLVQRWTNRMIECMVQNLCFSSFFSCFLSFHLRYILFHFVASALARLSVMRQPSLWRAVARCAFFPGTSAEADWGWYWAASLWYPCSLAASYKLNLISKVFCSVQICCSSVVSWRSLWFVLLLAGFKCSYALRQLAAPWPTPFFCATARTASTVKTARNWASWG